ncbi:MAG: hypothetical protein JWM11_839 [Planctomycetaceae bacterium]|nr:hypothetical protein [Planctomycetaceae bacterium]
MRLILEIFVTLFDLIVSRYLIAATIVGVIWLPFYLFASAHYKYWLWSSLILGCGLTGLWDGCQLFALRPFLSKWLFIRDRHN